ncbi:MAG: EamA family transporter [Promethearchaeota archaeon]
MKNKYILHLIFANILWGLIPVLVKDLFKELSILTVIFLRFFISGIILFFLAILLIYMNNKNLEMESAKISLKRLLKFAFQRNEAFYNIKYIYHFIIIGFLGIILQIIFFFLALKTTSIAFTMTGFPLSIILIAFYEHGVKTEKLDLFKALYLIILTFTIIIILFVYIENPEMIPKGGSIVILKGIIYIVSFALCLMFLQIAMNKESYSESEIKFMNINRNYKIIRMIIELSFVFLIGTALMFPFLLMANYIPLLEDLTSETNQFFSELYSFYLYLANWEVLFLIIFSTIIPYILIFIASVKWSPYNLTYGQWSGILTLIEPIGGILFGVIIIKEYFPPLYLLIVLFLLIISILLRYTHESRNIVNASILITHEKGFLKDLPLKLLKLDGVQSIESLIGIHDLKLNVRMNSIKDFYLLTNKLRDYNEIKEIKIIFIEDINKLL